jgi:large repetitive protein
MLARLKGLLQPRRSLVLLALFLVGVTTASAAWHLPGAGAGAARASTDFHAPSVTGATIVPQGATAAGGAIKPGATFVIYANVVDPGVSGVAWVRTNVSALQTGATSVSLSPCTTSCTIGSTTYGWSTAPLTADAGLAQGTRSYGVWSQDNANNLGTTVNYSAIVDSTSPSVTAAVVAMASPATVGWVHRSGSYTIYASATDSGSPASGIATVTANVAGLTPGTTSLALPACTSACSVGGVSYGFKSAATVAGSAIVDGSASVSLSAADKAGNTATGTASVTVDSTPPTVTGAVVVNTTPSDPGYLKPGNNYIVYANAGDTAGLSTVTADVSALTAGQTAVGLSACTSSCTYGGVTYGYKSGSKTAGAAIAAGQTGFTVTATDKAANATPATYSVTVDSTGPTVSGVAIANTTTNAAGWLRKSGAYAVYANTSDPSGISSLKANVTTITSGQTAVALSSCSSACTVGGVTYAYKSASKTADSTLAAGAASFTVTATDGVGNAATVNGSATADNTAPTASAEAIAPTATGVPGYIGQGRSYMVYTNAADASSDVYSVTAKVSNITTGQTVLALPACISGCTIGGVGRGYASAALTANASITGTSKTWTVTVTDLAGNATTSANQTVVVDNTAPTVAITFPTSSYPGGWLAGCGTASTADICGTASDASSGVASVQVSLRQASAPGLYWNPATSSFSSATEVLMPATGTTSWSLAAASAWFTNLTSYTIRAVATDSASNPAAPVTTTFTWKP